MVVNQVLGAKVDRTSVDCWLAAPKEDSLGVLFSAEEKDFAAFFLAPQQPEEVCLRDL